MKKMKFAVILTLTLPSEAPVTSFCPLKSQVMAQTRFFI
jgi:hypothetical protein